MALVISIADSIGIQMDDPWFEGFEKISEAEKASMGNAGMGAIPVMPLLSLGASIFGGRSARRAAAREADTQRRAEIQALQMQLEARTAQSIRDQQERFDVELVEARAGEFRTQLASIRKPYTFAVPGQASQVTFYTDAEAVARGLDPARRGTAVSIGVGDQTPQAQIKTAPAGPRSVASMLSSTTMIALAVILALGYLWARGD